MSMAHPERISLDVELRVVKEDLELAKKTRDRYALLVTKLYDELDTLRNGVCDKCKMKFGLGAPSSSFAGCTSASSPQPTVASNSMIASTRQASFKSTLVPTQPQPRTPPAIDNAGASVAKPDERDWSVVYNHEVRQTLDVHLAHTLRMKSEVYCVKFSRDGKHLAVGLETGETYIYDMKTLSYRILTMVEYPSKEQPPILATQFSPDDKCIATGGSEGLIRIWNLAERRVLAIFRHTKVVFSVDFSPDGRFLLSSSFDGSVRLWCMRDGSSKMLLDSGMSLVASAAISPDGRYVAAGDYLGILRIWDSRSGQLLQRGKDGEPQWSLVFTSDGKGLLSGGKDKTLRSWDISSLGSRRRDLTGGIVKECLIFRGHTGSIGSVSIFPDSRWLVSGSADSTARIWDARTGAWECILNGHNKAAGAADASPDGGHVATGADDCLVRVWRYV